MQEGPLPTASAEMVLIGVGLRALVASMGDKQRRRFVRKMSCVLDELNGGPTTKVVRVIADHADPNLTTSRAQASAWWAMMREAIERDCIG